MSHKQRGDTINKELANQLCGIHRQPGKATLNKAARASDAARQEIWAAIESGDALRLRRAMQVPDVGDNPYIRGAMCRDIHNHMGAASHAYRSGVLVSVLVLDAWNTWLQTPEVPQLTVLAKFVRIHNRIHPHPILRSA